MKAVIQVGVRKHGRVRDHCGPHTPVTRQVVEAPENFTTRQLALSVAVSEVKQALYRAGARDDGLDTLEFMVDFEED